MNRDRILAMLQEVESGSLAAEAALEQLARFPFIDTPHARVDTQRGLRQGLPEVVFGPGKTVEQIIEVVRALADSGESVEVVVAVPASDEIGIGVIVGVRTSVGEESSCLTRPREERHVAVGEPFS